jgi:hypothetical protein
LKFQLSKEDSGRIVGYSAICLYSTMPIPYSILKNIACHHNKYLRVFFGL